MLELGNKKKLRPKTANEINSFKTGGIYMETKNKVRKKSANEINH